MMHIPEGLFVGLSFNKLEDDTGKEATAGLKPFITLSSTLSELDLRR